MSTNLTRAVSVRRSGTASLRQRQQPLGRAPARSSSAPPSKVIAVRHQTTAANPSNPWATNTAPAPPPLPPRVISRRAWESYQQQNPTRYAKPKSNNNSQTAADEKPWPKSVIYTAYVLGGTLVPYFGTWLVVANDTLRPQILPRLSETVEQGLRSHFGTPELDQVPYTDQFDWEASSSSSSDGGKKEIVIPHAFRGETTCHVREQQKVIDQTISDDQNVPLQLQVYHHDGSRMENNNNHLLISDETKSLPGSTLASPRQLLADKGIDGDDNNKNTLVAVHFPEDDASSTETSISFGEDSTLELNDSSSSTLNTLQNRLAIYSVWHYQPVAPQKTDSDSDAKFQERDLQKALLQDEVFQLEQELRSGNSVRSVDDIVQDLDQAKGKLRRLSQWWWPF